MKTLHIVVQVTKETGARENLYASADQGDMLSLCAELNTNAFKSSAHEYELVDVEPTMPEGLTLTTNERAMLLDIYRDEYSNGSLNPVPWSWSVVSGSRARAGVLSSLTQKGLVGTHGTGRDATCWLTDKGRTALLFLLADGGE